MVRLKKIVSIVFLAWGTLTFLIEHPGGADIKYRLCMGFNPGECAKVIYDGPLKKITVKVPDGFVLYFTAIAYNATQESEKSNEVIHQFKLQPRLED